MKIADALLLQQDLANEISRLKSLAEQESYGFRSMASARGVGEEWKPTFDIEKNHQKVMELTKLKRRLSRAVSKANNSFDIEIDDAPYKPYL